MKYHNVLFLFIIFSLAVVSCEKDNPQELKENNTLVEQANKLLSDTIVLSTKAKIGTTDKTLLENGCPAKYYFQWNAEKEKLYMRLVKFQVGNMPFAVVFFAYATYSELNTWEKDEYFEEGWVKFRADDGVVIPYVPEGQEEPKADGAGIVTGYVNPKTEEIEFVINYNMMNVTSHSFRQKIDKNRINGYEEEFKQYEKDLKKYKEEHGL